MLRCVPYEPNFFPLSCSLTLYTLFAHGLHSLLLPHRRRCRHRIWDWVIIVIYTHDFFNTHGDSFCHKICNVLNSMWIGRPNPIYIHSLSLSRSNPLELHVKRLTQLYCACVRLCGFFSFYSIGIRVLKSKSMSTTTPIPFSFATFSSLFMLCFNRNELKTILAQNFGPDTECVVNILYVRMKSDWIKMWCVCFYGY